MYLKYIGNWGSESVVYTFVGKRGDEIIECKRSAVTQKNLKVTFDKEELVESDTVDALTVTCEVTDQNNQRLVYFQGALSVKISGQAKLIGPSLISFAGGSAVFTIRSNGKAGEAILDIECPGFEGVSRIIPVFRE